MKNFVTATILMAIILVSFSMESCTKNTDEAMDGGTLKKDSWAIIQDDILTLSCATSGCHGSTSDATYAQHNLLLNSTNAYENLINVPAKNQAAKTAGLVRVKPGDHMNSLLFHKIDCQSPTTYGASMPLGGTNLTAGQIEFIKQWIMKGAPKKGSVVDENILNSNAVCSQPFVSMAAPAAADGFQLAINAFTVSPKTEREVFVNRISPNTSTVYVKLPYKGGQTVTILCYMGSKIVR
jgi:hypothetical protein